MKTLYARLSEKDRRRYAAVEADKLGRGGVQYIAKLFAVEPKTLQQGLADQDDIEDPAGQQVRKKGRTQGKTCVESELGLRLS
ncbi:MAG: hypothetical protein ACRC52_08685 [Aeromonas veronii]